MIMRKFEIESLLKKKLVEVLRKVVATKGNRIHYSEVRELFNELVGAGEVEISAPSGEQKISIPTGNIITPQQQELLNEIQKIINSIKLSPTREEVETLFREVKDRLDASLAKDVQRLLDRERPQGSPIEEETKLKHAYLLLIVDDVVKNLWDIAKKLFAPSEVPEEVRSAINIVPNAYMPHELQKRIIGVYRKVVEKLLEKGGHLPVPPNFFVDLGKTKIYDEEIEVGKGILTWVWSMGYLSIFLLVPPKEKGIAYLYCAEAEYLSRILTPHWDKRLNPLDIRAMAQSDENGYFLTSHVLRVLYFPFVRELASYTRNVFLDVVADDNSVYIDSDKGRVCVYKDGKILLRPTYIKEILNRLKFAEFWGEFKRKI